MTPLNADRVSHIGRIYFAIALVAFGVAHFVTRTVVIGRAPDWPAGLPGQIPLAYLTGALCIVAGLGELMRRSRTSPQNDRGHDWAAWAMLGVAATIAGWALLRHIPLVAADQLLGGRWTNAGKALALTGGALAIARPRQLRWAGCVALGAFFVLAGVQHFMFAEFVKTLVPAWVPGALAWTYIAGAGLIAGGIGLMIPMTSRLAALATGAMIFTWFLILHIPRAISMNDQNEWTAVVEALAMSGIALALSRRPATSDGAERESA